MKQTQLYKDITTDTIYTLAEVKSNYEVANDCDLPIDNETMLSIIYENLYQVGGNIAIISNNDEVLKWCNDYAERQEADRVMTQEEIDESIRDVYIAIIRNNNSELIQSTLDNLYEDNAEDLELINRLNKFVSIEINENFLDDKEKMYDFVRLTKEDFLASYGYLTEKAYNDTLEAYNKRK